MEFKKGDIVLVNDYGLNKLYKNVPRKKRKMKTTLFNVSKQKNEEIINVDRMNGTPVLSILSPDIFRLATPFEIKLYTVKSIFN